ncbi:MAG: hypothetical protein IJ180_07555, partial [Bacteroidales bacterium]|nr:hypothetical protein [Bacteroidales bacterium]
MQYINDNLKVEGQITQNDGKNVLDTSSVVNNSPTLSYGTTSTIGSVGGTALKVTMPNKPSYNLNEISETNTRFFKKVAPRYDITESNWYSIGTIEDHAIYKIQVNSIWHYTAMTLLNFTVAFGYELQRTKVILHDVYLSKSKAFSKFRLVQIDPRVLRIDVYYTKNLYNEMYACIECCTKGMLGKTKVNTTTTIA